MNQGLWSRWHCFNINGIKIVKRFEINEIPTQLVGYTEWVRGTGPHTPEARTNIGNGIRRACKGVPKPQSQKEKMSLAKKGKPKTLEHRKNMSLAQKRRIMIQRYEQSRQNLSEVN